MKMFVLTFFILLLSAPEVDMAPQFICVKKSNARNICYYNFKIDGEKFHFMDIGCKYSREKLMKKIAKGNIALAKDWKIPC